MFKEQKSFQLSPLVSYARKDNLQDGDLSQKVNIYNVLAGTKPSFILKGLNTFNLGSTMKQAQSTTSAQHNKFAHQKESPQNQMPAYQKLPVYQENKQFFYDIVYVPASKEVRNVDKDIIHESVYGKNWRKKFNKSALATSKQYNQQATESARDITSENGIKNTQSIGGVTTTRGSMPDLIIKSRKKKNLNDITSIYLSSEEDSEKSNDQKQSEEISKLNNSIRSNYSLRASLVQKKGHNHGISTNSSLGGNFQKFSKNLNLPNSTRFSDRKNQIYHSEFIVENDYNEDDYNNKRFQVTQKKQFNFSQRISEQAIFDYYRNYKNLKASLEREEHKKFPQSAYIHQCEESNLIPRPYGMVSYKGEEQELNVQNFLMGNNYAKAYGSGLQFLQTKRINISNNRLNENGTLSILKGLNKKVVEEIDISNNKIGFEGMTYLGGLIVKAEDGFNLRVLKLESTQITDQTLSVLIEALESVCDSPKCNLQELNLACNQITCTGAEKIAQYISKDPLNMRHINLHWNKIKIKGGMKLAEAIQINTNLRVLDLSWNAMGKLSTTFAG